MSSMTVWETIKCWQSRIFQLNELVIQRVLTVKTFMEIPIFMILSPIAMERMANVFSKGGWYHFAQ